MFDTITDPAAQPDPAPPPQTAARERMGILRRFSEIGLRIAERIDRESETAAVLAGSSARDEAVQAEARRRLETTAKAFAHLSRAVSVSIALEDRIERGPPLPSPPFGPELVCPIPRQARLTTRREEVETAVVNAINLSAEVRPRPIAEIDDLCRNLDRLLDREMAQVDAFLCQPAEEIVTRLCRRIGIDPEWAFLDRPA